ncbi:ribosomal protein S18-alanine N-acetyltransferase [bacterium]|nr:ribosomal protein S18-alanine N-acetyltransferase [bacterium]
MTEPIKLKIKQLTTQDIDSIIEIEEKAYGKHHWSRDSFLNELSNRLAIYYGAFDETNNLVGYVGCWQIIEEAHITNLAVNPEKRRMHIGETLLNILIKHCYSNGVKYLTLEVRVSNIAAINLYEKYGFKSLSTRKHYYQDNDEDALIMWTENIFYDKFKSVFEKNEMNLVKMVEIL